MRVGDEYVDTFRDLADYTDTLRAHYEGTIQVLGVKIGDSRNALQHRLLCLPPGMELNDSLEPNPSDDGNVSPCDLLAYEACRLTALIYSVMVTFPLPRSKYARDCGLTTLEQVFSAVDPSSQGPDAARLYFWCLIVAGIGAFDHEHRAWFMAQTRKLAQELQVWSWEEAEAILITFAWLKCACSSAGRDFWDQVWQE